MGPLCDSVWKTMEAQKAFFQSTAVRINEAKSPTMNFNSKWWPQEGLGGSPAEVKTIHSLPIFLTDNWIKSNEFQLALPHFFSSFKMELNYSQDPLPQKHVQLLHDSQTVCRSLQIKTNVAV